MTSVGPNWCGTGANQSGGNQWTNPTNIQGSGTGSITFATQTTTTLICTNFGFAVPGAATIDGLELTVYSSSLSANTNLDNSVKLRNAGTPFGDEKAQSGAWPSGSNSRTYGGSTDNWGGLTAAQVNSSTFGVGLSYKPFVSGGTMSLDRVSITVYYTNPPVTKDVPASGRLSQQPIKSITASATISRIPLANVTAAGRFSVPHSKDATGSARLGLIHTKDMAASARIIHTGIRNVTGAGAISQVASKSVTAGAVLALGGESSIAASALISAYGPLIPTVAIARLHGQPRPAIGRMKRPGG